MPKIVCAECQVELVIEKTGAVCCDMFNRPPIPYQLWNCDAWKCPGCGATVLAGFPDSPFVQHYEPDFPLMLEKAVRGAKKWFIRNFERVGDKDEENPE